MPVRVITGKGAIMPKITATQNPTTAEPMTLMHPTEHAPATAERVGWYVAKGRTIGLKLKVPGGHTACLTYAEIRELQAGLEVFNSE